MNSEASAAPAVAEKLNGCYMPSPDAEIRTQVGLYEQSAGTAGNRLAGVPVVILTTVGRRSGNVRKNPVMRVENAGRYLAVASFGGRPEHPLWYHNIMAFPYVRLQDGPTARVMRARELSGQEKREWWVRAAAVWPDYDRYQEMTDRQIPLLLLEP
jgi:F420H(2)-dependent quinone reductase